MVTMPSTCDIICLLEVHVTSEVSEDQLEEVCSNGNKNRGLARDLLCHVHARKKNYATSKLGLDLPVLW